jgi:hypothetical protein
MILYNKTKDCNKVLNHLLVEVKAMKEPAEEKLRSNYAIFGRHGKTPKNNIIGELKLTHVTRNSLLYYRLIKVFQKLI